jgi:phosphoribosylaminoimidazolecarboxamide formyltransferase / IMP cyclohydrolase
MQQKERYALISVSDKTDVVGFAEGLAFRGFKIISTGGTAEHLRKGGVSVTDVSEFTGHPECLDGRVKTLQPKIFAGILARDTPEHEATLAKLGYPCIEIVAVNLYPFEATIAKRGVTVAQAIEQIDIGGPSLIRAAAKNAGRVTVIVDPTDYDTVLYEVNHLGCVQPALRHTLAAKVFRTTAAYDRVIAEYLTAKSIL